MLPPMGAAENGPCRDLIRRTQNVLAPMPARKRYEYTLDSNAGSGCSSHDLFCLFDGGHAEML